MSLLKRKISAPFHILNKAVLGFVIMWAVACAPEDIQPDPNLYGEWANPSTIVTFNNDKTYVRIYPRKGNINDPTLRDSIYGTYEVDAKRKNITFTLLGYRERFVTEQGDTAFRLVSAKIAAGVWNYDLKVDTLRYESLTERGSLVKQAP